VVIKKIRPPSHAAGKPASLGIKDLLRYIEGAKLDNPEEKVTYAGSREFISSTSGGRAAEMVALAAQTVHSKVPVSHWMISWKEGEQPTVEQVERAVDIFLEETGLIGHQVVYGVHDDTKNVHLHLAVNRVHPQTLKVARINGGWDKEAGHKVIAKIEVEQGWQREKHGRYEYSEEQGFARVGKRGEMTIPGEVRDFEVMQGEDSAIWVGQERGLGILKTAESWEDLHTRLAAVGMKYERQGSGAVIFVGEMAVKASSIARACSFEKMQKKLGSFRPRQGEEGISYEYIGRERVQEFDTQLSGEGPDSVCEGCPNAVWHLLGNRKEAKKNKSMLRVYCLLMRALIDDNLEKCDGVRIQMLK
jgi:hypothetical protein